MRAIQTHLLTPSTMPESSTEKLWIYNGLDCCVTLEVLDAIRPQADNTVLNTYKFSKSLQGPILEMGLHGLLIDDDKRRSLIGELSKKIDLLKSNLERILAEGLDLPDLNWRSPAQLKHLFYKVLGLPEVKKKGKDGYSVTVDRDALEKLSTYFFAEPIVNHLLLMRDIAKKISVLETDVDTDGRMRTSFNIGGTTTGRLSSSYNELGVGGNLQNVEDLLRGIFVADPGMKFAYIDLEQAESRAVGGILWNLFNDGRYLDAAEEGDLHTAVTRMVYPNLSWTGNPKEDKIVAEQPFYRQHSYRHMCKVLGHGSSYGGRPETMEKHTKISASAIKDFQSKFFGTFPGIIQWHGHVRDTLAREGRLTTMLGRRRWFWGRRTEPSTIREAIASEPQSMVADILNQGMLKVWRLNICQLLLQIHDAILVQYPEDLEDQILPILINTITVPVELSRGRTLIIPSEAKTGWNWASWSKDNPDGLQKYKPGTGDERKRDRKPPTSIMDRFISRVDGPNALAENL